MTREERQRQARRAQRLRATGAIRQDAEAHFHVNGTASPYEPRWHRRFHGLARKAERFALKQEIGAPAPGELDDFEAE